MIEPNETTTNVFAAGDVGAIRSLRGHELVGNGHRVLMAWNAQLEEHAEVPMTVFPFISNLAAVVSFWAWGWSRASREISTPGWSA